MTDKFHPSSVPCTLQAINLISDTGVGILIHIGINTVQMNGEGFTAHVRTGDTFAAGDLLTEFDTDAILKAGCLLDILALMNNRDDYSAVEIVDSYVVASGVPLMSVVK